MPHADGKLARYLVAWYALYQTGHIFVNTRGLFILHTGGTLDFPAPAADGGWSSDVVHVMIAVGWLDLIGAALTIYFAWGYFLQKPWRFWLGTVCLTISTYAFGLYTYWTAASGAWSGPNLVKYLFVDITFIPILVLFILFAIWGMTGKLNQAAQGQTLEKP
jgi:hypothetical protein